METNQENIYYSAISSSKSFSLKDERPRSRHLASEDDKDVGPKPLLEQFEKKTIRMIFHHQPRSVWLVRAAREYH